MLEIIRFQNAKQSRKIKQLNLPDAIINPPVILLNPQPLRHPDNLPEPRRSPHFPSNLAIPIHISPLFSAQHAQIQTIEHIIKIIS